MHTKEFLMGQLRSLGIAPGDTVTIHSSLKQIGPVAGGGEGLIRAFREAVEEGLVLIPAHTYLNIREEPVFDVRETLPCIGTLPKVAVELANRGEGVRSLNPSHSVVAFGEGAAEFVAEDALVETALPMSGCYGKLCRCRGKILLAGVGLNKNTFLHAVFEAVEENHNPKTPVTVIDQDGRETLRWNSRAYGYSADFTRFETALEKAGALRRGKLGDAETLVCDAALSFQVVRAELLREMHCSARILQEGYDGKTCLVHARGAVHGENWLVTAQDLDVTGSDAFACLQVNFSRDGGKTWTGFRPDPVFASTFDETYRTVPSDMTPMYHKKTGKFLITGHTVDYFLGEKFPVPEIHRHRVTPYSVFDVATGKFAPVKNLVMPPEFTDCGSGCSQGVELENGEILLPVAFSQLENEEKLPDKVVVLRCGFDGETLEVLEIGNQLAVPDSFRGIGEASILAFAGKYYLTIRDDDHGYVAVSEDGLHFDQPRLWRWEDGEILPTYNTQSHWLTAGGKAYLVYTRKNGRNDHVFRHRAPLYAAELNPETVTLRRETEFAVVPERGARLGNFGVCPLNGETALVVAAEWMQPAGCEAYGSKNAIWLVEVK